MCPQLPEAAVCLKNWILNNTFSHFLPTRCTAGFSAEGKEAGFYETARAVRDFWDDIYGLVHN